MDGIIGCPFFVALLPIGIYNSKTVERVLERSAGLKFENLFLQEIQGAETTN